jgi:hypothetical protein
MIAGSSHVLTCAGIVHLEPHQLLNCTWRHPNGLSRTSRIIMEHAKHSSTHYLDSASVVGGLQQGHME